MKAHILGFEIKPPSIITLADFFTELGNGDPENFAGYNLPFSSSCGSIFATGLSIGKIRRAKTRKTGHKRLSTDVPLSFCPPQPVRTLGSNVQQRDDS